MESDFDHREIAREFSVAVLTADCLEALPSDAWLDARLRERGCPEDELATWRAKIKAMPLRGIADGAC
jgi:hypothetical protein